MKQHITQEQAEALAHRRASAAYQTEYVNSTIPGYTSYAFAPHTLMDFVRDIEAAAIQHYIDSQPKGWPCEIITADFEQDTITLKMTCNNYRVRAGTHLLTAAPSPKDGV